MKGWIAHEMQGTKMPDKRLSRILTDLTQNSAESIPSACQGWSETKGVYRDFVIILA